MIDIDGLTMDEKVLVYADPDLIHQVVYNLLDNAIKDVYKRQGVFLLVCQISASLSRRLSGTATMPLFGSMVQKG